MRKTYHKIDKWIDTTLLPRGKRKNGKEYIDWKKSVGISLPFCYEDITGNATIVENLDSCHVKIYIDEYTKADGYRIEKRNLLQCQFGRIFIRPIIQDIPNILDYLVSPEDAYKYSRTSKEIIETKCPICGNKKMMYVSSLYRSLIIYGEYSCDICSDKISYPNKFMRSILNQLNIKFIPEYSPNWAYPYRYDFYFELNKEKYIVEMDGIFHYLKKSKVASNDIEKNDLAKNHDINVIRIDCNYKTIEHRFNYIKSSVSNSKLANILDLSRVNFNECNNFAVSNLLKKVCDMWKYKNKTPKEISKELNVCHGTILNYLHVGTKIGLCSYNPKESRRQQLEKPINMYKDGTLIATFNNSMQCSKSSLELFGIYLGQDAIRRVCRGELQHYKGFTFEFIGKNNNTKLL